MILVVNGDSHTAAAEAVVPFAFAEDDPDFENLGRLPHPQNLQYSWGKVLADSLGSEFVCLAESASSNSRILRTTYRWINRQKSLEDVLLLIQLSTWEREEWLIDDIYYQVNASGIDVVPESHHQAYKEFVISIDWNEKTNEAHDTVWKFHQYLKHLNIKHVFFNGNSHFGSIKDRYDWGVNYMNPYDVDHTYDTVLRKQGCHPVNPHSWHFNGEGHRKWSDFMYKYLLDNNFIPN